MRSRSADTVVWMTGADSLRVQALLRAARRAVEYQGRSESWAELSACVRECSSVVLHTAARIVVEAADG
jgi:hypothetical protein